MAELSARERLDWLRLIRSENVGPITFYKLIERYGSAARALEALPELAQRGGGKALRIHPAGEAEREVARLEKVGARLIARGEPDYPRYLAEVEDAPPLITVLGHPALLNRPALGVVGARNASLSGRRIAESFSRDIGQAGYVIVSGLARGIDTAAHGATLDSGTVAVIAGGIDVVYPPENETLYRDIAARGCIVAESPFGTEPLARHFPRRNRIISGISLGVLIVEAAAKSGSLITARMALEQNREVFAVPGSPLDPRSEGANSLIKDGAHIATRAADIVDILRGLKVQSLRDRPGDNWQGGAESDGAGQKIDDNLRQRVLENLSYSPIPLDLLIRELKAPIPHILTIILELELAGRIERQAGNKVNLI